MKAIAVERNPGWLTSELRRMGYSEETQFDVRVGTEYEMHAVAVWSGVVVYLIVGDSGITTWIPAAAFSLADRSIPLDWRINIFASHVPLVIGPEFIVADAQAYDDMIDLDPESVRQFRERLAKRDGSSLP